MGNIYFEQMGNNCMILILLFSSLAYGAIPPEAIIKSGLCPTNYKVSGDYCQPLSNAKFAIAKNGICPENYSVSGNYCLALDSAKRAIPKSGLCPIGYQPSGNYCLLNKKG